MIVGLFQRLRICLLLLLNLISPVIRESLWTVIKRDLLSFFKYPLRNYDITNTFDCLLEFAYCCFSVSFWNFQKLYFVNMLPQLSLLSYWFESFSQQRWLRVWVTASLLKSSGLFSVLWPILIMLWSGCSLLVLKFLSLLCSKCSDYN